MCYVKHMEVLYMKEITDLLINAGTTVVIIAYFIFRDFKFMQKLDATLDVIAELLKENKDHGKE